MYKVEERGSTVHEVDRFFHPQKPALAVASFTKSLLLKTVHGPASPCRTEHDRDLNAAVNLKQAASSAGSARGADIRPVAFESSATALKREGEKVAYG